MASPAFDHNSGLLECVEDLPIQQFVSEPTSVTPIARIASATGVPCATSTSTWRSLETISSLEFGHSGWVAQCLNQAVENGSFHFRDVGGLT